MRRIENPAPSAGFSLFGSYSSRSFGRSGAAAMRMAVGVSLRQRRAKGVSGPRFLGAPIRLPGVPPCSPWGPGAPSACASHPVCRSGPAHVGILADPPTLFCLTALPVAPSPPSHHSPLHVCRNAATGDPGPYLRRGSSGAASFAPRLRRLWPL